MTTAGELIEYLRRADPSSEVLLAVRPVQQLEVADVAVFDAEEVDRPVVYLICGDQPADGPDAPPGLVPNRKDSQ